MELSLGKLVSRLPAVGIVGDQGVAQKNLIIAAVGRSGRSF
jgi:hypothetical protein